MTTTADPRSTAEGVPSSGEPDEQPGQTLTTPARENGAWNDASLTPRARAAALLAAMTAAEKLAQLGSSWPGAETGVDHSGGQVAPIAAVGGTAPPFTEAILGGLGQITRAFGTAPIDPQEGKQLLIDLQHQVVDANRFGIPALAHEECLTGVTAWRATVYPTSLAWAATWDPDLVEQMAAAIGQDLAALGVHQGLSPVLDVVRDHRWGRVEETMGEDPHLVSELGLAYVEGLQSAGVVATLKHFAGYSASRGARNHAPAALGARELADVILIPFEKAVIAGGVRSVMNSYAEIDGVPAGADHELLTTLLREQWGFEGTVVSDYWSVPFLATMHAIAADADDAGRQALRAGIDVELPHTISYGPAMLTALANGDLESAVLDTAVLRVLTQKAELGLLDASWTPEGAASTAAVDLDSPRNRDVARRMAEQSVVLLANRGALPMSAPASIAVIGPCADDAACLFGCYSFPNHVVVNHPDVELGIAAPTVLDAIRAENPGADVQHVPGCGIRGEDRSGITAAVQAAEVAEVTVLVVGDRSGMFGAGTSGEGCDVKDLQLPGVQDELVQAVLDAAAATSERPARTVVLVVLSGRPYAIGRHSDRADASLQVFFPGQDGAAAIAGVLSGRVNPSGHLPVQIPGEAASNPATYLAPPLALRTEGVSEIDPSPAFAFGHGLSFTTFEVEALHASADVIASSGEVVLEAVVANTGQRAGATVAQLYLGDPVASVTRPVRQLLAFQRVELEPGQRVRVAFTINADLISFTGRDLRRRVEPGEVIFTAATSSGQDGHSAAVEILGPVRQVDHTRVLRPRVDVLPE